MQAVLFSALLLTSHSHADVLEEIISWETLTRDEVEELLVKTKLTEREEITRSLIYAKAFILQGDLESADFLLRKIVAPENQLSLIKYRYQATIAFLRGDYKEALAKLDHPFFSLPEYYREICLLRVLSLMPAGPGPTLSRELSSCNGASLIYSETSGFWLRGLDLVMRAKFERFPGLRGNDALDLAGDPDLFRAWSKLALFSNMEETVLARVSEFPYGVFASKSNREILGFLYYRTGNLSEASRLTEDLEGPNVENIRGNLALKKQAYELALGHFQLALKKKDNSLNALQRALPLSWILGRYADGLDFIDKISFANLSAQKKLFLKAAYTYASGQRDLASKMIEVIEAGDKDGLSLEIQLLSLSSSIHTKNKKETRDNSLRACRRFDGIACWSQLAHFYWDHLGMVARRQESVLAETDVKASVSALVSGSTIKPLEERVYIDQKDIEELDGSALDEILKKHGPR